MTDRQAQHRRNIPKARACLIASLLLRRNAGIDEAAQPSSYIFVDTPASASAGQDPPNIFGAVSARRLRRSSREHYTRRYAERDIVQRHGPIMYTEGGRQIAPLEEAGAAR